ncbi:MAG TPA: exodeoxyribonuclease VII large subunit [Solirubrobacterales bacterium]|nr:exodeoxyribonuclease VII large subunit [Solirubrobacterales bacterium]
MEHPPETGSEDAAGTSPGGAGPLPTPVGEYAARLTAELRGMDRVTITGELSDVRRTRVQTYFQLRDDRGGISCAIWNNVFDQTGLPPETLRDGAAIIAHGGPDYYPGGKAASPAFSFRVTSLRPAGEGDLLARLAALRKQFDAEGLLQPQKLLPRPVLPKRIGVITAEGGAARQDLLVGLERRGWQGEIVWGFAPVQDRKAAPAITRALATMATMADVEAIVVCRGGGSLTDLWAFCDENLCRTVAALAVPVISAVGHERDTTLIDDVAAVRASTPTHAAEAVVRLDCVRARTDLLATAATLDRAARSAVTGRIAPLTARANGPSRAVRVQRGALNQRTREVRASSERGQGKRRADLIGGTARQLNSSVARTSRAVESGLARTGAAPAMLANRVSRQLEHDRVHVDRQAVALRAHDPQRTLERGYARVEDDAAEPVVSSKAARKAGDLKIHFADGVIAASVGKARRAAPRRRQPDQDNEFQQTSFEGVDPDE